MTLGFIGLGIMGRPMSINLVKAGHTVLVHSRSQAAVEEVVAQGATYASYAELGRRCDAVFTMLPNAPQVREVLFGEEGLAQHLRPGQTLIDCSSIDPMESKAIAKTLAERGVEMLDAPVSGSDVKAKDGTLAFMVGGKEAVFAKFQPILLNMGASVVRCGEVGAGNTVKLANQIIVACNIQALAEALTLAKKAGVEPQTVFEAIKGGLAGSTVMNAKAPMMIAGDAKPGFMVDLHIKDLGNVLSCAHAVGAPVPMTAQAQEVLCWLSAQGLGKADHSAMIEYYKSLTGLDTL